MFGQVEVIFPSFSSLDPTLEYIVHWECLLCQLRLYTSGSIISLAITAAVGDSIKAVFSSILWLVKKKLFYNTIIDRIRVELN